MLTDRWTPLRPHPIQLAYWQSSHRFNVIPAGRRSGKTERAKRKLAKRALRGTRFRPARFFASAPTHKQARDIYWDDLKRLIPRALQTRRPSETDRIIYTPLSEIHVVGLDAPERIEGSPWDGGLLDEYANMHAEVWPLHVRPALSDRLGWCDFLGVPEGRNHYFKLYREALRSMQEHDGKGDWGAYTWPSADILDPAEIEAARRDMDPLSFEQEYEASFVNFVGRAYYTFTEEKHVRRLRDRYDPEAPLVIALDFNVSPGVAAIGQEMLLPSGMQGTGWIGEVWIPQNSNTPAVCRRLLKDWGDHKGPVRVYGDATGGAKGSAKVEGSDWDIARTILRRGHDHEGDIVRGFKDRVSFRVPDANPSERGRVNAVNSRLLSSDGSIRMMLDGEGCPHLIDDFEGVRTLEGGSGEIDKKKDPALTHISDGAGYYVAYEFPTSRTPTSGFRVAI